MSYGSEKQLFLRPQDLVVVLKLHLCRFKTTTYADLGNSLFMSPSVVHASVKRAGVCRLIHMQDLTPVPAKSALLEFVSHGLPYVFPGLIGPLTRGVPTAGSAPPLNGKLNVQEGFGTVWPHPSGGLRGKALVPLYPSAPEAAIKDTALHELLALVDAIRAGDAREREIAVDEFARRVL